MLKMGNPSSKIPDLGCGGQGLGVGVFGLRSGCSGASAGWSCRPTRQLDVRQVAHLNSEQCWIGVSGFQKPSLV